MLARKLVARAVSSWLTPCSRSSPSSARASACRVGGLQQCRNASDRELPGAHRREIETELLQRSACSSAVATSTLRR
jgi:hypothetical protein